MATGDTELIGNCEASAATFEQAPIAKMSFVQNTAATFGSSSNMRAAAAPQ